MTDDEIEVPADQPDPDYVDDGTDDDPPLEPVPTEGTPEDNVPAALFAAEDPDAEPAAGVEP